MMTLVLLTACGGTAAGDPAEELALAARSEYMAECTLERTGDSELLRVLCADPEDPPGTGRETALWFDPETYALVRGEISVDGYRVIQCELTGFTRG